MADSLYIYTMPWVKTFFKTSIAFSKHFKDKRQREKNKFRLFLEQNDNPKAVRFHFSSPEDEYGDYWFFAKLDNGKSFVFKTPTAFQKAGISCN